MPTSSGGPSSPRLGETGFALVGGAAVVGNTTMVVALPEETPVLLPLAPLHRVSHRTVVSPKLRRQKWRLSSMMRS